MTIHNDILDNDTRSDEYSATTEERVCSCGQAFTCRRKSLMLYCPDCDPPLVSNVDEFFDIGGNR